VEDNYTPFGQLGTENPCPYSIVDYGCLSFLQSKAIGCHYALIFSFFIMLISVVISNNLVFFHILREGRVTMEELVCWLPAYRFFSTPGKVMSMPYNMANREFSIVQGLILVELLCLESNNVLM
jgi:hypothetical protein